VPLSGQKVVLIVDDTPTNVAVISGLLEDSFRIKVATNGETALAIAQATDKPDLILLDVEMPGMDGYEVCRRLKASPATCEIPTIFLTGRTEAADEQKGFEVGAVDYIHKPFSAPIVLARVNSQPDGRPRRGHGARWHDRHDRDGDAVAKHPRLHATGRWRGSEPAAEAAVKVRHLVKTAGIGDFDDPEMIVAWVR
jgi:CheY-like chemotaxis protein